MAVSAGREPEGGRPGEGVPGTNEIIADPGRDAQRTRRGGTRDEPLSRRDATEDDAFPFTGGSRFRRVGSGLPMHVPWLFVSLAVALARALAYYAAFDRPLRVRRVALLACWAVVVPTPWIVPASNPFGRLLAGVWAGLAMGAKLWDAHLGLTRGFRPAFRDYAVWLVNLSSVVLRKLDAEPRPPRREESRRLGVQALRSVPGALLFAGCFVVDWPRRSRSSWSIASRSSPSS